MKDNLLALGGAVVGGAIGIVAFRLLLSQGLEGLVLPGGLLGIGAGFSKNHSIFIAIVCGSVALALGIVVEWYYFPFIADQSLGFFVAHLFDLPISTLIMIVLGGLLGFWCPFQKLRRTAKPSTTTSIQESTSP